MQIFISKIEEKWSLNFLNFFISSLRSSILSHLLISYNELSSILLRRRNITLMMKIRVTHFLHFILQIKYFEIKLPFNRIYQITFFSRQKKKEEKRIKFDQHENKLCPVRNSRATPRKWNGSSWFHMDDPSFSSDRDGESLSEDATVGVTTRIT